MPTDMEQATGLERLELLGKMEGVDIFDMRPLDASRLGMMMFLLTGHACTIWVARMTYTSIYLSLVAGTMQDPIKVQGAGPEQYVGCTGSPADSHMVTWLTVSACFLSGTTNAVVSQTGFV
jgi:cytochrome c oxidase subunit 5b